MIQPRSLDQINVPNRKGMFFGGPGLGKTVAACSSLTKNTFLLDVDNGIDAVWAFRKKYGLRTDNVKYHPIESMKDSVDAWAWIAANINWIRDGIVVVDSMTELQRVGMREHLKTSKKKYAEQRQWGMILTDFEDMFADVRHLPFNMVITAHEFHRTDEDKGITQWRPSFQGRFANEYAKHLSFIGRYQVAYVPGVNEYGQQIWNVARGINFGPDPSIHCKDRSGMLGTFEYPDIDQILGKMALGVPSYEQSHIAWEQQMYEQQQQQIAQQMQYEYEMQQYQLQMQQYQQQFQQP